MFNPGFQKSETSRAEVTIYSFGDEPGLAFFGSSFTMMVLAAPATGDGQPTLVHVDMTNALGVASCAFVIDVKADKPGRDLIGAVADDDWVDIVFTKHGVRTHVLRGQVEDVRLVDTVDANGATVNVVRIAGRDFGRIFDITPIWFDIITDGALGAGATARVLEANASFFGDPASTVEALLSGFLSEVYGVGRGNWELPPSVPNTVSEFNGASDTVGEATFIRNCCFFDKDFLNYPERSNTIDFSIFPGSNQKLWDFAMTWADLPLCEVYTDLLRPQGEDQLIVASANERRDLTFGRVPDAVEYPFDEDGDTTGLELTPDNSIMSVIYRDRPFPTYSRTTDGATVEPIEDGPWFTRLNTYRVPPQHIAHKDVGRSTAERKNAFYAAPRLLHELVGGYFDLNGPLWSPDDMKRHGFRREDVIFNYVSHDGGDLLRLSQIYRERVRDFHCMNHLFLSGSILLGNGRPDIRVGHRFRIVGTTSDENETYYIETIRHTWSLKPGLRTVLGVTRGWIGTDSSLIDAMNDIVGRYRRPDPHTGSDEPQPEPNGPPAPDDADDIKHAEHYPPNDARTVALFTSAAVTAAVPATWADPSTLDGAAVHALLGLESQGYVGRPNPTYGSRAKRFSKWQEVWAELKAGQFNQQGGSSASGLGQLLLPNTDLYYPSHRQGIGVASEEAVGMLRYIQARYTTPVAALAFWKLHSWY